MATRRGSSSQNNHAGSNVTNTHTSSTHPENFYNNAEAMGVNNGNRGKVNIARDFSHPLWGSSQDSTSSSSPQTPLSEPPPQCQNYYDNSCALGVNNGDDGEVTLGQSNTNQNGTSQSTEVARENQHPRPTGHNSPQGLPSNRSQFKALPPPDLGENIRSQVRDQNRKRPAQPTIPDSMISHGGQSRSQNSNSQSSRRHGQ